MTAPSDQEQAEPGTNPRHSQSYQIGDDTSTTIGFAEFGSNQAGAQAVIYLHGLPGSRHEAAIWEPEALRRNIRLIAPDRQGLGLSSRDSARTLLDYPAHLARLIRHLGVSERFWIVGVSGGGPYALACAAAVRRTDLLSGLQGVAVVAGLGPRELTKSGMSLAQRLSFHAMDWVPAVLVRWFWDALVGSVARNRDRTVLSKAVRKGFAGAKGPDAELYRDERLLECMTESIRGAFIQGSDGYVDEASLVSKAWGFQLDEVDCSSTPLSLWYGGKDELAPPAVGQAMADRIPGANFKCFDGETHLATVIRHQGEILGALCG